MTEILWFASKDKLKEKNSYTLKKTALSVINMNLNFSLLNLAKRDWTLDLLAYSLIKATLALIFLVN